MEGSGTPAYSFPPSPLLSQHSGSARAEPGHWGQQLCCTGQQGLTQLRVAEDAYAQCYRQWEWQSWQWVDKKDQWLHYLDVLAIVGAGLFLDKTAYTVKSKEQPCYPHVSGLPYDYKNVQRKQKRARGKVKAGMLVSRLNFECAPLPTHNSIGRGQKPSWFEALEHNPCLIIGWQPVMQM